VQRPHVTRDWHSAMTTSRETYEQYCASVGVQPMAEMEWNAYNNNMRDREVAGFFCAADKAATELNRTPHDDRAINPKPQQQPQTITCRPTHVIHKRDFHGRNRRRLADLLHMEKAKAGARP
jgi:hypothetical protein